MSAPAPPCKAHRVETFRSNTLIEARAMAQDAIEASDGHVVLAVEDDEANEVTVMWRMTE